MPDTNPPKVTMADEDLRSKLKAGNDESLPARKWSCPEDDMLAAYADGTLREMRQKWVEFHLSGCARCRLLVAEAVKAQRELDLPSPPTDLRWKAIGFAAPRAARQRWVWVPAGALAAVAVLVVTAPILRKPQSLILQSPPSPSAPVIAKSEPVAAPGPAGHEIVRKPTPSEPLPSIVLPRPDSVVTRRGLKFGWRSIAQSRYYEVRVVNSDGDLVWEGQTDKSDLQLPADTVVQDGSYFVWITAYLADGRIAKSAPVKFLLKQ
jgi:hypothetical protein